MAQLLDMGFPAGLAAKALLLNRNEPAVALDWALQHAEDADADAPPSPEALAQGEAATRGLKNRGRHGSKLSGAYMQTDTCSTSLQP